VDSDVVGISQFAQVQRQFLLICIVGS